VAERVRDLMTKEVHTVGRNDPVTTVDALMEERRIRHVPVLDEEGALAGIVSRRDVFRSAMKRLLGYGTHAQDRMLANLVVKEVMTNAVETIGPDAPLAEAARRMIERRIGSLVVVEGERLVGILTDTDFVRKVAGL
jgi:CBS domain-containing protein